MKALVVALLLLLLSPVAAAQNVCGPRDDIIQKLWDRWKEAHTARGLINDGRMVEVFVSSGEEQSWTVIISDSSGRSCVASAGKNWVVFDRPRVPGRGT